MDTLAAILIVTFQLIFGWCGGEPGHGPPDAPAAAAFGR
jgi:hypothetical protein